jgi:hypothetical protein
MSDTLARSVSAFDATQVNTCGILHRDGIFYATLKIWGEELPLEVALHGVRSEQEAQQAFSTLVQLRQAQCNSQFQPSSGLSIVK